MVKKYNFNDDFEMLYLRHDYMSKIDNHDETVVEEFKPITNTTARLMYDKYRANFDKVGFEVEDLQAICSVYLLAYMSLYSIRNNDEKRERVVGKFQLWNNTKELPTQEYLDRIERNDIINFLRQRVSHCSTLCARKGRNIRGGRDIRRAYAETVGSISADDEVVLENPGKFGYRKVTKKELKTIKAEAREAGRMELLDKNGFRVREIEKLDNGINHREYRMLFDGNRGPYFNDPETTITNVEDDKSINYYSDKFNGMGVKGKTTLLTIFINENKGIPYLKSELKCARKMLKTIKNMV